MTVNDLIQELRIDLNDTQTVEFSDQELITKINSALRWLSLELAMLHSPTTIEKTILTITNGNALLPNDFISEVAVKLGTKQLASSTPTFFVSNDTNSYYIANNKIYINVPDNSTIDLFYHKQIPAVNSLTDTLQIQDYLIDIIREFVIITAKRRIDLITSPDILNDLRTKLIHLNYINTSNIQNMDITPFFIISDFGFR